MEQTSLNFDSPHLLSDEEAVLSCLGHGRQAATSSTIIEASDGVEREEDPAGHPVLITTTQIYTHVAQARKAEAIETFDAYRSLSVGEKRNKINAPH